MVESEVNKGSKIFLYITQCILLQSGMNDKRILVVDDDQNARNLYQTVLTDAGFKSKQQLMGSEALIKCQAGGYDLVL